MLCVLILHFYLCTYVVFVAVRCYNFLEVRSQPHVASICLAAMWLSALQSCPRKCQMIVNCQVKLLAMEVCTKRHGGVRKEAEAEAEAKQLAGSASWPNRRKGVISRQMHGSDVGSVDP